jgi:hypothetical protein|tara:strand:- start:181 stop:381 length:201 start_codon:yes stop_codon:yes gene_type:complete
MARGLNVKLWGASVKAEASPATNTYDPRDIDPSFFPCFITRLMHDAVEVRNAVNPEPYDTNPTTPA